jgi:immunoglobulin-binding protein 1
MLNFDDRYLGVDYLLAELLVRTYGSNRQKLLQQASWLFENFLSRLDSYELLSKQNKQLLDQYQDDRKKFQLASATDAAERRRVKVARFQEEKALKTKLEVFGFLRSHFLYSDKQIAPKNTVRADRY